jgi:predicted Zn-dependent protease
VNTGVIVTASNEAELAAVLSNAIAHVSARHLMQVLTKAQILQLSAIPGTAMAWHWSKGEPQRIVELEGTKSMYEKEADQLAIQYLWNTGYDPATYITILEKLPTLQLKNQDRVGSAMMELNNLPDKRPYAVNSSEFDTIKRHLLKR